MLHNVYNAIKYFSYAVSVITIIANMVGTLIVLALVLVVDYDVIAREAFNKPFMGAVEVVQFSMVLIVFLQLPDVIRVNRLMRSDGFLLILHHRKPKWAILLRKFINLVSAGVMITIAIAIWPEFVEMYISKDFFGIPGVFTALYWPIKLTIFISAVLCSITFLLKTILNYTQYDKYTNYTKIQY